MAERQPNPLIQLQMLCILKKNNFTVDVFEKVDYHIQKLLNMCVGKHSALFAKVYRS